MFSITSSAGFTALRVIVALVPLAASAQSTTWIGTVGDWGSAENWSKGEPTIDVGAEIRTASSPRVTQAGEACRDLVLDISVGGSVLTVQSGSLTIADRLVLASSAGGVVSQTGGAVSAAQLAIGVAGSGAYSMLGGTFAASVARIGSDDAGTSGAFTMSTGQPACTITDSLIVLSGGSFHCGAGTLNVGTTAGDGAWIHGVLAVSNAPAVTMTALTLSETATLSIFIGPAGVSTMTIVGTATLGGRVLLTDIGASDGTYDVLVASPLEGVFSTAFLPPGWTWQAEGNVLRLTRGPLPVAHSSWGQVKAHFTD